MQFTPKSEKEIQAANLLPAGEYDFTVVRAEDTKSKAGNDMIKVTIGVYQQNGTQRLMDDYLLESVPHKLRHFAETIGLLAQYEMGQLGADELEGRAGRVKIRIKEQTDYPSKNEVKDYVVDKSKREFKPPLGLPVPSFVNKPLPGEEDDLPI